MTPRRGRLVRPVLCLVLVGTLFLAGRASGLTILDEGIAQVDTAFSCGAHRGRLLVNTGVHYQRTETDERRNAISIAFADSTSTALECCWVQFVWIEEILTFQTPNGRVEGRGRGMTIGSSGGPVVVSEDPTRPRWHVDAVVPANPCYEIEGVSIKDRNGTRIFDQPDDGTGELGPIMVARTPPGNTLLKLEERKHFEAYLVCNRQVCFVVRWEQVHTWAPGPAGGPPVQTGPQYTASGEPATSIRPEQRAALTSEHPNQTVLPP